jgi:hypothetical protein
VFQDPFDTLVLNVGRYTFNFISVCLLLENDFPVEQS